MEKEKEQKPSSEFWKAYTQSRQMDSAHNGLSILDWTLNENLIASCKVSGGEGFLPTQLG